MEEFRRYMPFGIVAAVVASLLTVWLDASDPGQLAVSIVISVPIFVAAAYLAARPSRRTKKP